MVSRKQVEVLLAGLVVSGKPDLHRLAGEVQGDSAAGSGVGGRSLEHGQGPSGVAVSLLRDECERFWIRLQRQLSQTPFAVAERPIDQHQQVVRRKRMQDEYAGSGQERPDYLEARVLGGSTDQTDGAVFSRGQQAVLLRLIEPVYLVHEENGLRPAGSKLLLGLEYDLADSRNAFADGTERNEGASSRAGYQVSERGLS